MPELPEVETVRLGLAKHLTGKRVEHVTVRRSDLRQPLPERLAGSLEGRTLTGIERRAKYLLFRFSNAQVLIVHLGMSGSLVLKTKSSAPLRKHDHVVMDWSGGMRLAFHDPRRFGLMALVSEKALAKHKLLAKLGPEPLPASWNGTHLYALLQSSRAPVKSVIMDQHKLVGVGNIYACEALFLAGVRPTRAAAKVTRKEAHALAAGIKKVLNAAIKSGGSTLRDYVRSSGEAGYFQHHFSVYGRAKMPCTVCGEPIRMLRQSGRSSFFCAHCQR